MQYFFSSYTFPSLHPIPPSLPPYLMKVKNDVELADVAKVPVQDLHKQVDHLVEG
jgi:hypothetical protein